MNKLQENYLKENFNIYKDNDIWDLEKWTDGGVDMFISINTNNNIVEEFENYLDNFDIDEEIDLYRQDKRYRDAFRITDSVDDFRDWENTIRNIMNKLDKLGGVENE